VGECILKMKFLYLNIMLFVSFSCFAGKGKLLIIGGGSEKNTSNSWNSQAYKWAIDKSDNKKVAIVSFAEADNWLPDYFVNSCGAAEARNFKINSAEISNNQTTYDELIQYDVIFLKGGNQYNYYRTYKNTKTQEAIEYIYNKGGVICGTSAGLAVLSEVVFTAENGSAYSDETIKNPNNTYVTLAKDFFNFFPGYIFDSHFTIRGRFGRLCGFLAHWKFNHGETISGIGVDEMTAFAIDENKVGTAFGIGTVNIYTPNSDDVFRQGGEVLLADSIRVTQLLQGCSYNFNTAAKFGFEQQFMPEIQFEKRDIVLLASGSDEVADNTPMLNQLVNHEGFNSDKILIITGSNKDNANQFKNALENHGATNVEVVAATLDLANSSILADKINESTKFLFVNNKMATLNSFIQNGTAGVALQTKITSSNSKVAFVGDNSRFAGTSVVEKYLVKDAVYYGEIQITKGLGLLETTVLIPNTFLDPDYYENVSAAIPYAMMNEKLTFGVWLNRENFIKYSMNENRQAVINAFGTSPVMILKNLGGGAGLSKQSAYGEPGDSFPNFAGFENGLLSFIDQTTPYLLGELSTNAPRPVKKEKIEISNTKYGIKVSGLTGEYILSMVNLNGQVVYNSKYNSVAHIEKSGFPKGVYIINVSNRLTERFSKKLVIH
jgi:cyanophycinase